jgi:hypothetical protein
MNARRLLAVAAWLLVSAVPAAAHDGARATMTLVPGTPTVGAACRITVVTAEATALGRLSRRAWVSADMPMHVMRPIEVELRRTAQPNVFSGEILFTMPGPWRVRLRVEDVDETMEGAVEVRVRSEGDDVAALTDVARHLVALQDAARATVFPPGTVLGGAVALALLMQSVAIIVRRRGPARARPAALTSAALTSRRGRHSV